MSEKSPLPALIAFWLFWHVHFVCASLQAGSKPGHCSPGPKEESPSQVGAGQGNIFLMRKRIQMSSLMLAFSFFVVLLLMFHDCVSHIVTASLVVE